MAMNSTVRTYLINVARQNNKFVYYSDIVKDCSLDINLSTDYGQHQLSVVLGEVSAFEDERQRPLISALAIYKDSRRNDHGDGFYKLAQDLKKGKFKELKEKLYAFEEAESAREFWKNDINFKQFYILNEFEDDKTEPDFFTREEIDFFKNWQRKIYNPALAEHVHAKDHLMATVWEKSKYLGSRIIAELPNFAYDGKKIWHQRGWNKSDEQSTQAAVFKPYTWIKVYRNTDKGKQVFFTFGIDVHPGTDAFVYKIDCQRTRDSKLNPKQIQLFDSLIPQTAKWREIGFEELFNGGWKALVATCLAFIKDQLSYYDNVISALFNDPLPPGAFRDKLILRDRPESSLSDLPLDNHKFIGADIDFERQAKVNKDLGDVGESLVIEMEKAYLISKKREDLAALVEIKKDGVGYDVLSFNEHGADKYIEVKTTNGDAQTPFYLSDNEIAFMDRFGSNYYLYRIYNYDSDNNFGEYYCLSSDIKSQLLLKPISYRVFLKKQSI